MAEECISDLLVLIFAPFGKDATLIARVLRQSAMNICAVESLQELESLISENAGAAIISEEVLQNGAIGTLAQRISAQPAWSDFAIIVLTGGGLSTASTESAVRSRAPLGNVTLLERPLGRSLSSAPCAAPCLRDDASTRCATIFANARLPRKLYSALMMPWNHWWNSGLPLCAASL